MTSPDKQTSSASVWQHLFAGTSFAVTLLLFVWAGVVLDRKVGCEPWGVIAVGGLGCVIAFWNLLREFRRRDGN